MRIIEGDTMSRTPSRHAGPFLLVFALSGLLHCGCAHAPAVMDDTAFRAADPHSILILPAVNRSTNVSAADILLSALPIPVAERGFYVFPVDLVKRVLEDEGCADADLVHRADPSRIGDLFGADAILYVAIEDWAIQNTLTDTRSVVEIDYVLKDARSGSTLWSGHVRKVNSGGGADPLASAMAAAILRALPAGLHLLPLARQASNEAFGNPGTGLPPGPYHADYPRGRR